MSGLAAVYHRDGRAADRMELLPMLAAVPYRGPDGVTARAFEEVGLGHAKMAVTPEEEHEQQPLVSPRTGNVLIADVRLDNREQLLSTLPDCPPARSSDADLILRSYDAWGVDCVRRLLGDFAFIIWDSHQRHIVCARDTSGQRGLYYRIDRGLFVAASEIIQLLQDPRVPIAPNEQLLREYLSPLGILASERDQAPETFYAGIHAVPAGHFLIIDRQVAQLRRYWDLDPRREIRYRRDEQYAEHFLELFSEVVRTRLRSTRPIGILLSGGLDSSSIACTAQRLYADGRARDRGFVAYSLTYQDLDYDERHYVREMCQTYGFEGREITPSTATDRLQLEPRGLSPTPHAGAMRISDDALRAASGDGTRAVLTGDFADGYVYGSPRVFDSLFRQGKLGELWRRLRSYQRVSGYRLRTIVAVDVVAPMLPPALQKRVMSTYLPRHYWWQEQRWLPAWLGSAVREDLTKRFLEQVLEREQARRFSSPARQLAYESLYPPEVALHPVPWPLEIWRPYADRRLHEFMLAIPPEQHFAHLPDDDHSYAASKRLVRCAMRGILPESVRTRQTKTTFNSVFRQELVERWAEYEQAFGPCGRSHLAERGYIDRPKFWSRLQEVRDGTWGLDGRYVGQMVKLETWLRAVSQPRLRPSSDRPQSVASHVGRGADQCPTVR